MSFRLKTFPVTLSLPTEGTACLSRLCGVEVSRRAVPLPEDNIHFTGEHTSVYHGWMQGAFESAQRVIKEING